MRCVAPIFPSHSKQQAFVVPAVPAAFQPRVVQSVCSHGGVARVEKPQALAAQQEAPAGAAPLSRLENNRHTHTASPTRTRQARNGAGWPRPAARKCFWRRTALTNASSVNAPCVTVPYQWYYVPVTRSARAGRSCQAAGHNTPAFYASRFRRNYLRSVFLSGRTQVSSSNTACVWLHTAR